MSNFDYKVAIQNTELKDYVIIWAESEVGKGTSFIFKIPMLSIAAGLILRS